MTKVWGTVVLDFDGVLNSYASGWTGSATDLPDDPTPGAQAFVEDLFEQGYDVVVASTRCHTERGRDEVARWLHYHGFAPELRVVAGKPPGLVYVDDRALRFEGPGRWPSMDEIAQAAIPWGKRLADVPVTGDEEDERSDG